ncbi:MAG: hypothetical protein ACI311_02590 [Bacilli bacterium]
MDSKKNNPKEDIEQQIDDLVDYIDNFMSKENAGHINITINKKGAINKDELFVDNTGGCVNGACKAPTLFEGVEEDDDKEE